VQTRWSLWLRWIAANALGELVGLGATFAVGFVVLARAGEPQGLVESIAGLLLMTASGLLEGLVVGLWQWGVLRRVFVRVSRRSWLAATLVGVLVAWFLGSLPATLMDMGADATQPAVQEPAPWVVMLLVGLMGLVLGLILALPQWWILRPSVDRAWVWFPANGVAWALGMPLVFAAVDLAYRVGTGWRAAVVMGLALALSGAVVGAVHGVGLVWLAARAARTEGRA
jgi:hypothetical protein